METEALKQLHDTIVLLGGSSEIAALLLCLDLVDDAAIARIKQYNIDLITAVKDRLANTHTINVRVRPPL